MKIKGFENYEINAAGKVMNIVSWGGGTNSTAMIIGMYQHNIPIDLILFADTGAERPETYAFMDEFNRWLAVHGLPAITVVEYHTADGERLTLEDECLQSKTLASIAYGYKKCSLKHKIGPQDKFCNNYPPCLEVWVRGERVHKYIGYDADEWERKEHAAVYDIVDKKYEKHYPLIDDWDWTRRKCVEVIRAEELTPPGKSSCFFCSSMKKHEIRNLYMKHPDLFARAIAIERNAKPTLQTVKGLARDWAWEDYINAAANQVTWFADMVGTPCNCYDG